MSDPFAAAERFVLAYTAGGEEHVGGRPADDILGLAAEDLEELTADGPEVAVVAMLTLLDIAVDLVAGATGAPRTDVVRSVVRLAEQRRAAR